MDIGKPVLFPLRLQGISVYETEIKMAEITF